MRILFFIIFFSPSIIFAQDPKVVVIPQDTNIKALKVPPDTNSKKILVKDTLGHLYNTYRGLLNDDPVYNKKEGIYSPFIKVIAGNVFLNLLDHYVFNYDFSR